MGKKGLKVNWNARAWKLWPQAEWIEGNSPIAALEHCRVLTITLVGTLNEATKESDDYPCGGPVLE